jgi:hypothetical protein
MLVMAGATGARRHVCPCACGARELRPAVHARLSRRPGSGQDRLITNQRTVAADAVVQPCIPSRVAAVRGLRELLIRRRSLVAAVARYHSLMEVASAPGTSAKWIRGLLYCGQAAGPVFVTVFLIEGAIRGYRPSRHRVSSLALGPRGWVQAAGLWRAGDPAPSAWVGPTLIGAPGAALIGSAVFTTDPVSGYPPGTPEALVRPSRRDRRPLYQRQKRALAPSAAPHKYTAWPHACPALVGIVNSAKSS